MKDIKFLVREQEDGVAISSVDGGCRYAFLRKLDNGKIVRTFYAAICDGIMSEGMDYSDMKTALNKTKEMIRRIYELNPKSFMEKC
ncbi:MAG: hypothetical protein M1155_00450 [Patescibacteria group bacterium]|nr:hypothetical protein [Patescibacteria group bacterium]